MLRGVCELYELAGPRSEFLPKQRDNRLFVGFYCPCLLMGGHWAGTAAAQGFGVLRSHGSISDTCTAPPVLTGTHWEVGMEQRPASSLFKSGEPQSLPFISLGAHCISYGFPEGRLPLTARWPLRNANFQLNIPFLPTFATSSSWPVGSAASIRI